MSKIISVCIPFYNMPNHEFFIRRCVDSVDKQILPEGWEVELCITDEGKMAENTNASIRKSTGDIIKILYMDDFLMHNYSLKRIIENFKGDWLVTGCNHDPGGNVHIPTWNEKIQEGINTIGSPSVLSMRKGKELYFDEEMTWLLDCDLYRRLYDEYGPPDILDEVNVTIGLHEGQATHLLEDEVKLQEHSYMYEKYNH